MGSGGTFEARYSGSRCGLCDEKIEEGELVAYVDGELCHADCAAEETDGRGAER